MNDQAGALRRIVSNIKQQRTRTPGQGARVISVTSGKGGVGKTNFTVNLALALSKKGLRVLIVDADFGLSNVDVILGLNPEYDLSHVVRHQKDVRGIICDGPYGIRFISGGSGVQDLIRLSETQLTRIMDNLLQLEDIADVILFDTGAGITGHILKMIRASQEVVVVTTPEPTAIMDAYALIKTISTGITDQRVRLVVNRADSDEEGRSTLSKIVAVVKLYLQLDVEELGYIPNDTAVAKAVRSQRPFVLSFPKSDAARSMEDIAWRVLDLEPEEKAGLKDFLLRLVGRGGRGNAPAAAELPLIAPANEETAEAENTARV